jgi:hypothetical protein
VETLCDKARHSYVVPARREVDPRWPALLSGQHLDQSGAQTLTREEGSGVAFIAPIARCKKEATHSAACNRFMTDTVPSAREVDPRQLARPSARHHVEPSTSTRPHRATREKARTIAIDVVPAPREADLRPPARLEVQVHGPPDMSSPTRGDPQTCTVSQRQHRYRHHTICTRSWSATAWESLSATPR